MCGRYTFFMRGRDLEDRVEKDIDEPASWRGEDLDRYQPSYNVAPSTDNPVVTVSNPAEISLYRWGLVPHWADDDKDWELINARSETVDEKPAFRDAFESRRCLVPAQGFYEWSEDESGVRRPYRVVPIDDADDLFYFAGLYERWTPPEAQQDLASYGTGAENSDDRELTTYTILTKPANAAVERVHDRMPVMLDGDDLHRWLTASPEEARALLDSHQTPADAVDVYPVSRAVNNPSNDSAELLVEAES